MPTDPDTAATRTAPCEHLWVLGNDECVRCGADYDVVMMPPSEVVGWPMPPARLPAAVGLCPVHHQEFWLPLEGEADIEQKCPILDCRETMAVYALTHTPPQPEPE